MGLNGVAGKVQTVLGVIEPDDLGITQTHEHILAHLTCNVTEPKEATAKAMYHRPMTSMGLDDMWWFRYCKGPSLDNQVLLDERLAIEELSRFKNAGGDSIVEMTNTDIGRDSSGLARISRATGINIIMGTGYYVQASMTPEMDKKGEEEITEEIVKDITAGVGNTGVRAGMIGEIGCTWPLTKNEIKSLRASAQAQKLTGAPLNVHPGLQQENSPSEIIKILKDAEADLSRTVISHIDIAVRVPENRFKLAKTGCYIEYDLFGHEGYWKPWWNVIDMPNDHQRLNEIALLIEKGHLDQILISTDIANKKCLCAFGGWGYDHILRDVVPVMHLKGFSEETIHTILVENPKRLLTFA